MRYNHDDVSTLKCESEKQTAVQYELNYRRIKEMRIDYVQKGDYLFPALTIPDDGIDPDRLGKYSRMRREYLKENDYPRYEYLLASGELRKHLADVQEEAEERIETIMKGLKKQYPFPDQNVDPVGWAAHWNMLTKMAEESILPELIYC